MNTKLKSGAESYIHYNGQNYPYTTVTYEIDGNAFYGVVSVEALERELFDDNMFPKGDEERCIDNKITFYVDNEDLLHLSNQELYDLIYD